MRQSGASTAGDDRIDGSRIRRWPPPPRSPPPPNPRLARVLREAGWILLLAAGALPRAGARHLRPGRPGPLLQRHGRADAPTAPARSARGSPSALLYLFGLSAWWWVALARLGHPAALRPRRGVGDRATAARSPCRSPASSSCSASSSALEALRLHSLKAALPLAPGRRAGRPARRRRPAPALGFTGGTLVLIALFAAAFSVFSGLSWIRFAEKVGAGVECARRGCARARIEARRDREEGQRRRAGRARRRSRRPRRSSRSTSRSASRCRRS